MQIIALISPLLLLLRPGHSFSTVSNLSARRIIGSHSLSSGLCKTRLFASTEEETAAEESKPEMSESSTVSTKVEPAVEPAPASAPYPIDLPSPLLLSASMVLAITSTGSLFELTGGTPSLGFAPQAALAAIGLPSSLFLIYAAILKGAAETEEDDKAYNKPRGF
ncbi:hypothetical protein ACHAWO_006478 [Cyclotella atomus]|uniref:Uncharacterized protein n=1 Tax=Cyclotella atomus TaxID=382360 RepID=A0ABD3Q347_9STRA